MTWLKHCRSKQHLTVFGHVRRVKLKHPTHTSATKHHRNFGSAEVIYQSKVTFSFTQSTLHKSVYSVKSVNLIAKKIFATPSSLTSSFREGKNTHFTLYTPSSKQALKRREFQCATRGSCPTDDEERHGRCGCYPC